MTKVVWQPPPKTTGCKKDKKGKKKINIIVDNDYKCGVGDSCFDFQVEWKRKDREAT